MKNRISLLLTALVLALALLPGCSFSASDGLDFRDREVGDGIDSGSFSGSFWDRSYQLDRKIPALRLDLCNDGGDSIFLYLDDGEPLEVLPGDRQSFCTPVCGSLSWSVRPRINGQTIVFSWSAVLVQPDAENVP